MSQDSIKGHHTWRWPHVKHALHKQETGFEVAGKDRLRVIKNLRDWTKNTALTHEYINEKIYLDVGAFRVTRAVRL